MVKVKCSKLIFWVFFCFFPIPALKLSSFIFILTKHIESCYPVEGREGWHEFVLAYFATSHLSHLLNFVLVC